MWKEVFNNIYEDVGECLLNRIIIRIIIKYSVIYIWNNIRRRGIIL